jgi:TRAP-type C4-dicarboxylate transport system permease small subunit
MGAFIATFKRLNGWMNNLAGVVLFLMMLLTVADVVLRMFGTAILGTYELVAVSGAVVVGFAIPQTSWEKGHVCVDFLIENRTGIARKLILAFTRLLGIGLFALLTWNMTLKAIHLYNTGEVSLTLHIPFFPAAFGLAFCFLIETFVLIADLVRVFEGGEHA